MRAPLNKNNCLNIKILPLTIALIGFSLFPSQKTEAAAWPLTDPAIDAAFEKFSEMISGAIMGAAKQAAATAINTQVTTLLGGGAQGQLFISDFRDFLIDQPEERTKQFMNAYLDQTVSGRGSLSNYIPSGDYDFYQSFARNSEGVGNNAFAYGMARSNPAYLGMINAAQAKGTDIGEFSASYAVNYASQLVAGAKAITTEKTEPQVTYAGNPRTMFASGNFKNLDTYLSGINNPWAYNLNAEHKYQEELEKEKEVAKTKGTVGQGFLGVEKNGQIVTPGSTIAATVASVQDLGNKVMAGIENPTELVTFVAGSYVNKYVTAAFQKGLVSVNAKIGKATIRLQGSIQQINREAQNINNSATRFNSEVNRLQSQMGPGALYNRN